MRKKQLELNLNQGRHGGRRIGSGRTRIHSKGVAHRIREKVTHRTPLHINFKVNASIRNKACLQILKRAIINSRRMGLRILHYSFQSNHIHLIIEVTANEDLTRGMRSLTVTFAKGLKKGRVQVERYHLHVLKSIRETRNAIHYVVFNSQKHGSKVVDMYSSFLSVQAVKDFAVKNRVSLTIKKGDIIPLDDGKSFLVRSS